MGVIILVFLVSRMFGNVFDKSVKWWEAEENEEKLHMYFIGAILTLASAVP